MKHTEYLKKKLQDDNFAVGYLQAALEEDDLHVFMLALKEVIEAKGLQKKKLAKQSGLSRNGLYTALTEDANPQFESVKNILKAVGFDLCISKSPVPCKELIS